MVTETIIEQFEAPPDLGDEAPGHGTVFLGATLTGLIPADMSQTATLRPVSPTRMLLGALRDARLRVRSAIEVRIDTENDDTIAEASEFNEFGFGKSLSEATSDLQRAIAELYFALEADQERLGEDLTATWDTLQHKIRKWDDDQGA